MSRPTPTSASLVEWLAPSSLSLDDGDDVLTWTGENAITFTGAVGERPTYFDGTQFSNGLPMVLFDGVDERMTVSGESALYNGTMTAIFAVVPFDLDRIVAGFVFNAEADGNPATMAVRVGSTERWQSIIRLDGSEGTTRPTGDSAYDVYSGVQIVSFRYDGTTAELRVNGVVNDTTAVSGLIDTDNPGVFSIGNHPTVQRPLKALVGEIGFYDDALSNADLEAVEDYLYARYNVGANLPGKYLTRNGSNPLITPDSGASEDRIFPAEIRRVGSTLYLFAAISVSSSFTKFDYWTAPVNDPDNWTRNAGSYIIDSATDSPTGVRGGTAAHDGTNWHILVESGAGVWYHFSGSDLASLTDNGAVFDNTDITFATAFPRHVNIMPDKIGGAWRIYGDYRTGSATSGFGGMFVTTTTDFSTFTTPVEATIAGNNQWYYRDDQASPCVIRKNGLYQLLFSGFHDTIPERTEAPHWLGFAYSSDGLTFRTLTPDAPILGMTSDNDTESCEQPLWHDDGEGNVKVYYRLRNDADEGVGAAEFAELGLAGTSLLKRIKYGIGLGTGLSV